MSKSFHFRIDLKGALMNWTDSEWRNCVKNDEGKMLSPQEVKSEFLDHLARGVAFIPLGTCDNWNGEKCCGHPTDKQESTL